jgi:hypothetical protein
MKNMFIAHSGSIQNIPNIPDNIKAIYKTVWEISQKKVLDLATCTDCRSCWQTAIIIPVLHFSQNSRQKENSLSRCQYEASGKPHFLQIYSNHGTS